TRPRPSQEAKARLRHLTRKARLAAQTRTATATARPMRCLSGGLGVPPTRRRPRRREMGRTAREWRQMMTATATATAGLARRAKGTASGREGGRMS
ncbi:hypothetical protein LTR60_007232, partial [Cryomyces antarcticus]